MLRHLITREPLVSFDQILQWRSLLIRPPVLRYFSVSQMVFRGTLGFREVKIRVP
jgi:hypothetical protein